MLNGGEPAMSAENVIVSGANDRLLQSQAANAFNQRSQRRVAVEVDDPVYLLVFWTRLDVLNRDKHDAVSGQQIRFPDTSVFRRSHGVFPRSLPGHDRCASS